MLVNIPSNYLHILGDICGAHTIKVPFPYFPDFQKMEFKDRWLVYFLILGINF